MRYGSSLNRAILVACIAVTLTAWSGHAQVMVSPPFAAATPTAGQRIFDADVAMGADGTLALLWVEMAGSNDYETGKAWTRHLSPLGAPLGPAHRIDTTAWVNFDVSPTIAADGGGGYAASWNILVPRAGGGYLMELYGAFLDADASPVGPDFELGPTDGALEVRAVVGDGIAGFPAGSVFAWLEGARLLASPHDAAREALGEAIDLATLGTTGSPQRLDLDETAGGFVAAWNEPAASVNRMQVFASDGQALGAPIVVAAEPTANVHAVAAHPDGGFAVMGSRALPSQQVWIRRFDGGGTLLGEDIVTVAPATTADGDLAFDRAGNLVAVWSELQGSSRLGKVRAYDASAAPLGPPLSLDPTARMANPRVAPLQGGRFVIVWPAATAVSASILSTCTPGAAVCGDGTLLSQCEECDDGAANSDTAPNACRTSCRRAHCGDGVLDATEECDDGNVVAGDCCSSRCRIEPDFDGDGVCDPTDDCRLFPNPDQSGAAICSPTPLSGLSEAQEEAFTGGLEEFSEIETAAAGLGPVFNGASCAECHHQPTIGGSSARVVTRIGRDGAGGAFDPMTDSGGSLLQVQGIATDECTVPGETVPAEATYVGTRESPALFGLGLVDAIADARILRLADPTDRNHDGVSGRANIVGGRVGRFGWKAHVATLAEFAALAYRDEMGITSPAFPDEVAPHGAPPVCDPTADPEDDGADVAAFTAFMRLLAPLPLPPPTKEARFGKRMFKRARCHACHTDKLRTDFADVRLRGKRVRMFSDLLLHDLGPGLADGIVQGAAAGSEFRTAPLWGVRASAPYLHDGRAATLEDAITAHGGEASAARDRYTTLLPEEKAALITFLGSL